MPQTHSPPSNDQDPRATHPNLEDYIAIKAACCTDYKHALRHLTTDLELKECAKYLSEWPSVRVMDQWKYGEAKCRVQAVIETAIRYMSGCSTFKVNPEAALFALDALHESEYPKDDFVGHLASPSDLARAHSCAAHAHYQKFTAPDAYRALYASIERRYGRRQTVEAGFGYPAHTSLKFALHHASESAKLGLVSSAVLRVGFAAREIGEGFGVDFGELVDRAKRYRPLWRAVADRVDELYAEARKALEGSRRDCPEYACGAEGCTMREKSSTAFRACSGKCPPDLKPRYCSKQCQVKDWTRHKVICKPGYGGRIPKIPDKSIALEWFELGDPETEPSAPAAKSDLRAPSVSDNLPLQDDSPECAVDGEKPRRGSVVYTAEETVQRSVHCHALAPRATEGSLKVQDGNGEHLHHNPDCAIPISRPDDIQASGNDLQHTAGAPKADQGDEATEESPSEEAAEDPRGDVVMLLVTQPVIYGRDDSQPQWSNHYIPMRTACFLDYRDARRGISPDMVLEPQHAKDVANLTNQEVSERWKGSDSEIRPAATLEMALRYMSGTCTVKRRPNPDAALFVLHAFHDPEHDSAEYVGASASRAELARAHALAAHAHHQKFTASDAERAGWAADYWRRRTAVPGDGEGAGEGRSDKGREPAHASLQCALHHASESAALGLVCSIGVCLGLVAREVGHGCGVDVARLPLAARARRFRPLWRAVDRFLDDLYAEAREEVGRGGLREDVCGAEGCPARARVGKAFLACSGTCPPDLKPRYCCKGCQVKDWASHKKICKPGIMGKIPKIPDRAVVLTWFELEDPEPEQETVRGPPVPEAKREIKPTPSPHTDVQDEDGPVPARTVDDKRPQEADGAESPLKTTADLENAVRVHSDEPTICGGHDSQDVQDDKSTVSTQDADGSNPTPLRLGPIVSTSRLDHAQAHCDSLDSDRTAENRKLQQCDGVIQETPGEAAEYGGIREAAKDKISKPELEHMGSSSTEGSPESEDSPVSSPDSEGPPSTPPELCRPLRPLVFGCMSQEYLRKMCEEEGPGALMDTGVWAWNPPAIFKEFYWWRVPHVVAPS